VVDAETSEETIATVTRRDREMRAKPARGQGQPPWNGGFVRRTGCNSPWCARRVSACDEGIRDRAGRGDKTDDGLLPVGRAAHSGGQRSRLGWTSAGYHHQQLSEIIRLCAEKAETVVEFSGGPCVLE